MSLSNKELVELIDSSIQEFQGDTRTLSNAIGYLMIGRQFGWKPLLLMYDRKSVKKYEEILGFDSKVVMPEIGKFANKSVAWKAVQRVSNFWKAVKGEIQGIRSTEIAK